MDDNNIYSMGGFRLASTSLHCWRKLVYSDYLPADVVEKIEEIIEALEYIDGWEPSDEMIQNHIDKRGMF